MHILAIAFVLHQWFYKWWQKQTIINDAKWSPNLDALPKHVSHLVHMPNVKLQNSSQESITCACYHV